MDILKRVAQKFHIFLSNRKNGQPKWQDQKINRPSQDACAILQQPIDVILLIADHLPQHGLFTLAQTCSQMQLILNHHYRLDYASLLQDRTESLDYIACLSRDMLNRWVCGQCVRLHAFTYNHYPKLKEKAVRGHQTRGLNDTALHTSHSHVQLTLKYTRLADRLDHAGWQYLKRLLAPSHGVLPDHRESPSAATISRMYRFEPRVVNGRYLLMIECSSYAYADGQSELDPLDWTFCRHQDAHRDAWFAANPLLRSLVNTPVTNDGGPEVSASCPYCATDVAVLRRERWSAVVRIWTDYGPEASPTNLCWRARLCESDIGFRSGFGRVRKLYESAKLD